MKYVFGRLRSIPPLAAALVLLSCAGAGEDEWMELTPGSGESGPVLNITGTVRPMEIEGGLYVIRDAEGVNYNPTNLPDDFRLDGLAIEAEVRRRDDLASIGMVGPLVDLVRIRRLPDPGAGDSGL